MKTISAELKSHLAQEVTTLAVCWKVVRRDGVTQGFTNHVDDIVYDGVTYEAATGFTPTDIVSTDDLAVNNMEVSGLLDSTAISESEIRAGKYDYADVYVFMVNYEDLTQGVLKLSYGKTGQIRHGEKVFEAEVRSLSQQLQQTIGEVFDTGCRADLGDSRCGVNVTPDRWAAHTYYSVDDVVRPTLSNGNERQYLCTTAGYSGSTEPSWDATIGNSTNGVSVELVTDGAFANAKGVYWTGSAAWTISGGVASCDGTQTSNDALAQTVTGVDGVIYEASFTVSNYSAGQVRIVCGAQAGTWRSADGTFDEDITMDGTTPISIEADSDFVGDIDDVSVAEKVDTVWETEDCYTKIGTITTATSSENFEDSARTEADDYFNGGLLTFTSGLNVGLSMEVKTFTSDTFQLALPFPYTIQVGDSYEVYAGCDKTASTCKNTYSNLVNFRGEPFIPGQDEIMKFGGQ